MKVAAPREGTVAVLRTQVALLASAIVIAIAAAGRVSAHELTRGVGTQTTYHFFTDRLEIELNLGFSASAGFPVLMALDTDGDDQISVAEAAVLLDERGKSLLPLLDLRVNGRPLEPRVLSSEEAGVRGTIMVKSFDLYFQVVAPIPPELPDGGWWLHFRDNNFDGETSTQFSWIPWLGHGPGISWLNFQPNLFVDEGGFRRTIGRDLVVFFDDDIRPEINPVEQDAPTPEALAAIELPGEGATGDSPIVVPGDGGTGSHQNATRAPSISEGVVTGGGGRIRIPGEEEKIGALVQSIVSGKRKGWELIAVFLLAIGFGAGHALGPGHGKSMVAAYLVGTKGRVRDAITLGAVVTFAHTFSIFLLGLLLLYLIGRATDPASGATYQNWLTTGFSLLSGMLLFGFGAFLLRRRLRVARGEVDPHGHHHSHGWWGHSHTHLGGDGHTHSHGDGHSHSHSHSHSHGDGDGENHHQPDHHHGEAEHGHSHEHSHSQEHAEAVVSETREEEGTAIGSRVRFGDLVALGFSGGIVPCPAGFTIMLVAAKYQALGLGLLILTFFSFGLGALLCGIGVVLVLGKGWIFDRLGSRSEALVRWLPVYSAGLVACIGVYFMWDSVSQGRAEIGNMLKALGERIGG